MSKRDYYEVLGVSRTVTEIELKSAFRKKAMEHHPDKNPGDQQAEIRFKEVNEAYQVLSDGQKRAAYDRHGHAAFEQGGGGGGPFGGGFQGGFGGASMGDIFEDLFGEVFGGGRRGGGGGRERGADLRHDLEITLDDAFHGKAATLKVPSSLTCETCTGTGAKPGSKPKKCATCNGMGRVRAAQGFFAIERTCHVCHGRGETIEDPCRTCMGAGRVMKERTLSINIPAGVEDGTRIRLSGEGEAGLRGGPAGDLYVFLSLKPHSLFQRDGADLFARVPLSMVSAALGTEIEVPTLDGSKAGVKIPEGTQSGKQFRIKGKGMPILRSKDRGDLFIQTVVETPQNLTKRQKELLREFESGSSPVTQPEAEGFFKRMKKDFFGGE